ncbi:MAG TPA: 1,4-alpha-glucan branching protein domain-containing protein [Candidatus Binatia bacterium]|nr:1,4-alpha-glucan branching protein domain-containing protein [Candidatus Binatia bacterium]
MTSAHGYLALLLHAHLPFVRHPEHGDFLEERWLFEALTETYVPLLSALHALARDGVPHRLTISLTPPLLNMLVDPLLQQRYVRHLDALISFSERELERTRGDGGLQRLAQFYRDLLRRTRRTFVDELEGNLVPAFRRLQDEGSLEIIACAATHGFLPLLRGCEAAVRAQVAVGVEEHRRFFGRDPLGIWLPECGFYPGLDAILAEHGLRYFVVETHGLLHAEPRPAFATYAPVVTPSGVAAFGRDVESSRQVWSASEGYPGDYDYRDFYRDVGFDLDYEIVRPLLPPSGERVATGFKYHRITGAGPQKDVYNPDWAAAKVNAHAANFTSARAQQISSVAERLGRPPIVLAPYDAELFGHWWFEGPQWLETFIRQAAYDQHEFALVTPGDFLAQHPVLQESMPAASSWGAGGYNSVWLAGENDWIYRHLDFAAERMSSLARRSPHAVGLELRALNQAARELLLAQSSDWAFIMSRGTVVEYAVQRTRAHLGRVQKLHDDIAAGAIDEDWLAIVEARDNIFPAIDYRVYA